MHQPMLPEVAGANSAKCWWLKRDPPDNDLRNIRRRKRYLASRVNSNDCQKDGSLINNVTILMTSS